MLCLVILIVYFSSGGLCDGPPEVETLLGKIRGSWKDFNGRKYAAFEGIPFAKPPIGQRRFEEAELIEPWAGIWEATNTYSCMQKSVQNLELIVGQEDCLYLNVYLPSEIIDPDKGYDVLVNIHGGGFMIGDGHITSSSDLVMEKELILVTINYRVGIFGFLSTEDEVIPGNNGMKDQVLALKWVKNNIASFGGNPDSVTIVGVSAGGASVHLHYLSPLSRGLFKRGISHCGTALNPWVIKENPLSEAKKLAGLVGCPDSSTRELKNCLQSRPGLLLMKKLDHFCGFGLFPISPFAPVVEINSNKPFLAKDPYLLLKEKDVLDVPWITSTSRDEGWFVGAMIETRLKEADESWTEIAHYLLDYNYTVPTSKRSEIANKIKQFYSVPDRLNSNNIENFTQIFTDRLFTVGAETAAKLQSKATKSPVYYFLFNFEGDFSFFKKWMPELTAVKGVPHGADAVYFYGMPGVKLTSERDLKMKSICQDMLYSFITAGKPSFGTSEWIPTDDSKLTYMNITSTDDIKLQTVENLSPSTFWQQLGIRENENLLVKDEL